METSDCPTPTAKIDYDPCLVMPEGPNQQWEYTDIIKQIMEKDSRRSLCLACFQNNSPEGKEHRAFDKTKLVKCSFYKHESTLIDAAEYKMKHPKKEYVNRKEQGARLACYKLWTMMEVGRLGRSRRRPLPVCVEARIKLMKPSETSQGYEEKEKEKEKEVKSSDDNDTWVGTIFNSPLGSYNKPQIS